MIHIIYLIALLGVIIVVELLLHPTRWEIA